MWFHHCWFLWICCTTGLVYAQRFTPPSFPNFVPVDPLPDLSDTRRPVQNRDPFNPTDYANFYQLKIFSEYELNATKWDEIWMDFDEHPVSMQRQLINELRSKQKTIEMMLISLCEDSCVREACSVSLERNIEIRPKNPDRWTRYFGLEWQEIPLKVKRMVVMQLRVDRFRMASALQMMNLEICTANPPMNGNREPVDHNNSSTSELPTTTIRPDSFN